MPETSWQARAFAGGIAAAAVAGLVLQYFASLHFNGSPAAALWAMLRFFTIVTNTLVAIVFGGVAVVRQPTHFHRLVAGTVLSIVLVGIVYALLLRGLVALNGSAWAANFLMHIVTPVAAPLYWLLFAPKGWLRYTAPWRWGLLPAGYLAYALTRGVFDGRYPYPFLNVARIGWAQTAVNCLTIGVAFIAAGFFFVWLDRRLARRRG
jgi:hypothetical protein